MKTELELTVEEATTLFEVIKIFTSRILDIVPSFTLVRDENGLSVVIKVPEVVTEDEIDKGTLVELNDAGYEYSLDGELATVKVKFVKELRKYDHTKF